MLTIAAFSLILVANIANAEIVVSNEYTYNSDTGVIEMRLLISSTEDVSNSKFTISQSDDAILDYRKGLYDSSKGPVTDPPEVEKVESSSGIVYTVPKLKNYQYIKTKFDVIPRNKECDGDSKTIIGAKIDVVYEGGQNPKDLEVSIPCSNKKGSGASILTYIIGTIIIIGVIVAVIIYLKKRRELV